MTNFVWHSLFYVSFRRFHFSLFSYSLVVLGSLVFYNLDYLKLDFIAELLLIMLSLNRIVFSKNFSYKNSVKHRNFSNKNRIKDVNYQYLQRSKVPTMHFQKSLPRLPVPELGKTSERYLNALRPILTSQQYEEAVKRTNDFTSNEGKLLQDKLILKDKANKHTSYISEYWFDLYLRDRAPLPINYNPLIVFQNDERPEYNNQLLRAANLLTSAVRFMLSLRDRVLEPEVYHMNPKKSNTPMFRTVTGLLPEAVSWFVASQFISNGCKMPSDVYVKLLTLMLMIKTDMLTKSFINN